MRVLGLDLEPSGYIACLCEGHAAPWPPVEVTGERTPGDAFNGGAWRRDLERFVGHPAPEVHRTVVAKPSGSVALPAAPIDATNISKGDAALLAALWDPSLPQFLGERIDLIVVGETAIEVYGFRLDPQRRVVGRSPVAVIDDVGHAAWVGEVVGRVLERLGDEGIRDVVARDLAAGAGELGSRLRDAGVDDDPIAWNGLHKDRLSSRVEFSRRACARWSSVQKLAHTLPDALESCARALNGRGAVLVAGIGATWPFAANIARPLRSVHSLSEPRLAVARGAAYWFVRGDQHFSKQASPEVALSTQAPIPALHADEGLDFECLARLATKGRPTA